ncbi:MAG TPA: 6-bladed beta-propeller, partial [Verrucomicrobiota bacterium]|nr:6-bladed beta-propeller [Verrucomicrobiota bacterium]
ESMLNGAARQASWVYLGVLFLFVSLSGCSPRNSESSYPLDSKVFSRVEVWGTRGVAPGQFNKPRSLVCDRDDNLYVADLTGRIQKFSPDGRFLLQWQMPQTDLGKPKGMTLDRDGQIVVVEPHYMRVNHFTPEGNLVSQWGIKGTNVGEFILPRAILQNSHGEYYVSEYTVVDRVQRFSSEAKFNGLQSASVPNTIAASPKVLPKVTLLTLWGSPGSAPGEFNRAEGLGLGPNDEVLVADSCNHRIQVFSPDGKFLRAYGQAGSNPGEFSYPYDVRVDSTGHQFVCEFGNSRITVLDAQDRVVEVIGGAGAAPGKFANPWAIALDSRGNLYVADSQNHRVQKLVRAKPLTTAH